MKAFGGLILAAPASSSGKTLVTLGLLRALRRRGVRVAAAKAGPDYIDPTFHEAASGGPCLNLDVWAMRLATLGGLVAGLEAAADIVLCEGVMGLFDGTGPDGERGSTAELARLTGWPVVLVVDARRQGASAAALVAGFARHDPAVPLAGIVFNRVAGARHRAVLETAMARHLPALPCLGAVPQDPALALPERHLGLIPAGEQVQSEAVIARAAEVAAACIEIERLLGLARPADPHPALARLRGRVPASSPSYPLPRKRGRVRVGVLAAGGDLGASLPEPLPPLGAHIAVARDDAFVFAYPAVLEGWRRAGAQVSQFAPLADEAPDREADAVYLPGGYPELHAGRLAACERFLEGLRQAAAAGAAVYGECGGYMVLGEALADADGAAHRMAGLLPLATSFAERRLHLGYRTARLLEAGRLGPAGAEFRGHEFHYATIVREAGAAPLFATRDAGGADLGPAGLRRGTVMGSFIHLIDRADGNSI